MRGETMGLFDRIFKKQNANVNNGALLFKSLTAYSPIFTNYGGQLYESELVRSAVNARATHISKLVPTITGAAQPSLKALLKASPNEWQTWGQFLYRLSTILDCQNTAFIVPVVDDYGRTTGIYPVLSSRCEIVEYQNTVYLRYKFSNGKVASIEFNRCGVMTKFQYKNDFFGESNSSLNPTLELINIQNQGIEEGVKSAATYRFMATAGNLTFGDDLAKERKRFTEDNLKSDGGGLLLFPSTYSNVQQINSKPFVVDAEQVNLIQKNVYNYYGVNEDVLQNKAFGDAWSAFYEGAIEPFAIQLSDVLTKMLFTSRERSMGASIMFTANRLQYMTNNDKLNVATQLVDRGLISINDAREIWNLPPVEGGDTRIIRGEYYDADSHLSVNEEDETNE